MTNGEKYLKEGADRQFLTDFSRWYYAITRDIKNVDTILAQFLSEKVQPTLTEDERVILNHINVYEFDKIARANNGDLYLHYREDKDTEDFWWCNHLFQFIKERRRILYRGTFEREIKQ